MITVGLNEKAGGATDRRQVAAARYRRRIYRDVVPRIVRAAPRAVLPAVTDPPEPLADIVRTSAGHDRVLSTGTFLDSLRFRVHLAQHFDVDANQVEAQVIREHGVSQVFLWSSAYRRRADWRARRPTRRNDGVRKQIEDTVRYANITIIEGK